MTSRDPIGRQEIAILPEIVQIIQHIIPLGEAREPSAGPRAYALIGVIGGNIFLHTQGLLFTLPRLPSLLQVKIKINKNNKITKGCGPIKAISCLPVASPKGF